MFLCSSFTLRRHEDDDDEREKTSNVGSLYNQCVQGSLSAIIVGLILRRDLKIWTVLSEL